MHFKHEDYSEALILNSPLAELIHEEFVEFKIEPTDVVDVFRDPASIGRVGILLKDALSGEVDADRMDYLARDSMFAGVTYGHYDVERLLDTLTVVEDGDGILRFAIEPGGIHALEGFLLARYSMFLQVYLAPIRRFYDIALMNFLREVLPDGLYPDPSSLEEYLAWDDVKVLELARTRAGDSQWASCLWHRSHWPTLAEIDGSDGQDLFEWARSAARVEAEFGDSVVLDIARARTRLAGTRPYITEGFEEGERPQVLVIDKTDRIRRVEDISALVRAISSQNILIRRLYAKVDIMDKARETFAARGS